jgi:hypothetical protein
MSFDEVTSTIDNGSWICIHVYIVQLWVRIPILFQVEQIVDGLGGNNLIKVIIVFLMRCGGLTSENMSKKLLCFGANGTFIFQGGKTSVTRQIKDVWAPFSMGVHCEAHRTNLVIKSLSNLTFYSCFNVFMMNLHSPKHHSKF